MHTISSRFSRLPIFQAVLLFLFFAACAQAVIYYPNPEYLTVGAATLNVDILRIPEFEGELAGFDSDELDTFVWYGPGVSLLDGQAVPLPRPGLANNQNDVVRVKIDASLLTKPGIAYIA